MKKIEAIVRPYLLEKLKEALNRVGAPGVTVSEVQGFGRQKGHIEHYRGAEYVVAFQPKAKLELVVKDSLVDRVVATLRDVAYTGRIGDGKIFVTPVLEAVRIRTADRGDFAVD